MTTTKHTERDFFATEKVTRFSLANKVSMSTHDNYVLGCQLHACFSSGAVCSKSYADDARVGSYWRRGRAVHDGRLDRAIQLRWSQLSISGERFVAGWRSLRIHYRLYSVFRLLRFFCWCKTWLCRARSQVSRFGRAKQIFWGNDFCFFSVCLQTNFLGTTKFGGTQKNWWHCPRIPADYGPGLRRFSPKRGHGSGTAHDYFQPLLHVQGWDDLNTLAKDLSLSCQILQCWG